MLGESKVELYGGAIQYEFEDEFLPDGLPHYITFKVVEVGGEVEDIIDVDY